MVLNHYSDEQLTSYLDNEMDAEECRVLRHCLKKDEALRRRVADLEQIKVNLHVAFDALLLLAPQLERFGSIGSPQTQRK